ncbi:MAG: hypothetical protein EXQ77_03660 [Thermoleophilia bacterium]|nr:hypothetical protein [Thermoleophilia bacterium]
MTSLVDEIAAGALAESKLWGACLRPEAEREREVVFSPLLADVRLALGFETVYEGYLLHHGRARAFGSDDPDLALLLGDTLLAQGLVRVAEAGNVRAVEDLAHLLSLCSQARAEGRPGDGVAWAATAARLGAGGLEDARAALRDGLDASPLEAVARDVAGDEAVTRALAAHARRVG